MNINSIKSYKTLSINQTGFNNKEVTQQRTDVKSLPNYIDAKTPVNVSFKCKLNQNQPKLYSKVNQCNKLSTSNVNDVVNISFRGAHEYVHAAADGDLERVKYEVLKNGVNINAEHEYARYEDDFSYRSALDKAAENGRYYVVDWLMSQPDINPNMVSGSGSTALPNAARNKHYSCFDRILNDPRTNPNCISIYVVDPCNGPIYYRDSLDWAVINNDMTLFDALLNHSKIKPLPEHIKLAKKYNNDDFATRLLNHPNFVLDIDELEKDPYFAPFINIGLALVKKDIEKREALLAQEKETVEGTQNALKQKENELATAETAIKKREAKLEKTIQTRTDEIYKQARIDAQKEIEKQKADLAKQRKELQQAKDKANTARQTFDKMIEDYNVLHAEDLRYDRETLASGLMSVYGINPPEKLPEDMKFGEQVVYVMNVLVPRQDKFADVNDEMPEAITKAIQDDSKKISNEGLKFLGRIIDLSKDKCSENELISAIKSVKGNYGSFDMGKVSLFIRTLSWGNNTIQSSIKQVQKLAV